MRYTNIPTARNTFDELQFCVTRNDRHSLIQNMASKRQKPIHLEKFSSTQSYREGRGDVASQCISLVVWKQKYSSYNLINMRSIILAS